MEDVLYAAALAPLGMFVYFLMLLKDRAQTGESWPRMTFWLLTGISAVAVLAAFAPPKSTPELAGYGAGFWVGVWLAHRLRLGRGRDVRSAAAPAARRPPPTP